MKNFYDENNSIDDDENEAQDEYAGYAVLDMNDGGKEVSLENKEKQKKPPEFKDCGSVPEASEIPLNEQTVMLDKAKVASLDIGALFFISIKNANTIAILSDGKKIGELKSAFSQKLLVDRKGQHAECYLHAKTPFAMVKLKFFARKRKNTVKVEI